MDFCLLIPCYNNIGGLTNSLISVNYYPNRFLILIVDDGSAVAINEEAIDAGIKNKLPVKVLRIDQNAGITAALNTGLLWIEKNCPVKYIARLDAGDTCGPERFFLQVNYMNAHPEVGLIGSWCIFEEKESGKKYSYTTPLTHKAIARAMHFRNVFIHPTVIFRKTVIEKIGLYPVVYPFAEDYAFFWRIIKNEQAFMLDKFLVTCEVNRRGISFSNQKEQFKSRQRVLSTYGDSIFLKAIGLLRLKLLFILPKRLILRLKQLIR
ncbi:MAG: glycosyltransferase [Bacteroidota bacterium]